LAANKNGVTNIQSFYNGNKNFEIDFSKFSFSETKHLNRLIDYAFFKKNKSRIQKLFLEPNNPLSLYKDVDNDGYISVEDSTSSVYKIRVKDHEGNDSWLTIPIEGSLNNDVEPKSMAITDHFVKADQSTNLEKGNYSISIPANSFYDDLYLDFDTINDTLILHEPTVPVKKNFTINYDISNYTDADKNRLFIGRIGGYKDQYVSYSSTKKKGSTLTTRTKTLGKYVLARDTEKPTITPVNFNDGKWLSKYRYLKVKLKDDLSGISVGNSSTFEATFFRK